MSYLAPIKDIQFALKYLAHYEQFQHLPAYQQVDLETAHAIIEEFAKFCESMIAPCNQVGDQHPATWNQGQVTTPAGFKEAYQQYTQAGWQGLLHPPEYGGQGIPKPIATACIEIINSANLSFALCPLLTDGAIEALLTAASDELKQRFLPHMISGKWTGTMNLTEPQAGSDLELLRTTAQAQDDGSYKIFGTKIYITYGDHDLADNIIHLVLARVPGAPAGVKGISLFVVPKFLVNEDGSLGERNDVDCLSIEHKLGIKASPTAVLQYGDHGGAKGYLVGEENHGLEYMFIMMNAARFNVGVQGIAIAERAYQHAVEYAKNRVQSRALEGASHGAVTIIHHPDVKRMLLTIRALTEGCRGTAFYAATLFDAMHTHPDSEQRVQAKQQYEYLVPIIKGFATEMSLEAASLGVQIHGGMGYIEETGAAQYLRDAKILAIYEGTTAIQANDLVSRKTARDDGHAARVLAGLIEETEHLLRSIQHPDALVMAERLSQSRRAFLEVVQFVCAYAKRKPNSVFAGSVAYLTLGGILVAGWQLGKSLLVATSKIAENEDPAFMKAKISVARFYADYLLTRSEGLKESILSGGDNIGQFPPELF